MSRTVAEAKGTVANMVTDEWYERGGEYKAKVKCESSERRPNAVGMSVKGGCEALRTISPGG